MRWSLGRIHNLYFSVFFVFGVSLGGVIACAPTKFTPAVGPLSVCDPTAQVCQAGTDGTTLIVQPFRVGAGKVDILFVIDNSASMSVVQRELAAKFNGFINALDSRDIDYRIAMTTTDLVASQSAPLITINPGGASGKTLFLSKEVPDRVLKFQQSVFRPETVRCENFIRTRYLSYGSSFQSNPEYVQNYDANCPSGDTRGIATAINAIKNSGTGFIRTDSNLSVILISNDEVRGGRLPMDPQTDTAEAFLAAVENMKSSNAGWANKFVEYNSIVTLDAACANIQETSLKDKEGAGGVTIRDSNGKPVIKANPGAEYVKLSSSASSDVDGNSRSYGLVKNICESDYTNTFKNVSDYIADSSRLMGLNCNAVSAPKVTIRGTSQTVPFLWKGDRILFQKGSEGLDITVEYKCNAGQVK